MSFITVCSSLAILVGLAASLPQLTCMARARSAAGQSRAGWMLGVVVNLLMAYVNHAGYHADMLVAGNVASIGLCIAAVLLIDRFGHADAPRHAAAAQDRQVELVAVAGPVTDLPTTEFVALQAALTAEARRRDIVAA
jgi:hypothetical protein